MQQKPVKKSHYTKSEDPKRLNDYVVDLDRDMFNFYTYMVNFPTVYRQASTPTLTSDGIALWDNTSTSKFYWICRINGVQKTLDFAASSSGGVNHAALSNLDYASAGHTGFQPAVSSGNLVGSTPLSVAGGNNAVLGGGAIVSIAQADTSTNGYVTNSDWGLFYNKADYIFGANAFSGTGNFVTTGTLSGNSIVSTTLTTNVISGNTAKITEVDVSGILSGNIVYANTVNVNGQVYGKGYHYKYRYIWATSANYTIIPEDDIIAFQGTTTCNIVSIIGKSVYIKNLSTGNVLVNGGGGAEYIDGEDTQTLYPNEGIHIMNYAAHQWAVV